MNKPIVIAGPCQHESYKHSYKIAKVCKSVCDQYDLKYYFKASFDKANRTYNDSPRGLGLENCIGRAAGHDAKCHQLPGVCGRHGPLYGGPECCGIRHVMISRQHQQ